jgi:hypothetical protein
MAFRVVMLLGGSVWTRRESGWRRDTVQIGGVHGLSTTDLLAAAVCEPFPQGTLLIYEPEGLVHQEVESPKVGRSVFASLARVKSEYPVVTADDLGWGMEVPEPTPAGSYSTLLHHELTPGLGRIRRACSDAGSRMPAAWSAFTAAAFCLGAHLPDAKVRMVLFLLPGFVAVAVCGGGKRSFKAWPIPLTERDWKVLAFFAGDIEARKAPSMAESEIRRGSILVISDGDPHGHCPVWDEIKASGRVESVLGLDAFAMGACQIPFGHPANLLEAFPRPLNLDPFLRVSAFAGAAFALCVGVMTIGDRRDLHSLQMTNAVHETVLGERLTVLAKNEEEMESLRTAAPDAPGFLPTDRGSALQGLAAAIPDALTLTTFSIARDDLFEIEAKVVGSDFEPQAVRGDLIRMGFALSADSSWSYDAANRRLTARGRFGDPQQ